MKGRFPSKVIFHQRSYQNTLVDLIFVQNPQTKLTGTDGQKKSLIEAGCLLPKNLQTQTDNSQNDMGLLDKGKF